MPSALFISPHLDDAAFSCGGTLIRLVREGWRVLLCTVFTRSVPNPQGFALACQLDKDLAPDVDYMRLRRAEDDDFARAAGLREWLHLDFPEAPHRGYSSAPELFAGVRPTDEVVIPVADELRRIAEPFELVFGPQGFGNHADHLQTIRAIEQAGLDKQTWWYRDLPYAIRKPNATPAVPPTEHLAIDIGSTLDAKIEACAAYRTQIPFQFGSLDLMARAFKDFHVRPPREFFEASTGTLRHPNLAPSCAEFENGPSGP